MEHEHLSRNSRTAVLGHPGYHAPGRHGHAVPQFGHVTHKLILEALFMTALLVAVLAVIFNMQNQSVSFASDTNTVSYGINTGKDPIQKSTTLFTTNMELNGGVATLTSDMSYSISAKVESAKRYNDSISEAVPYDLLLAWGKIADTEVDGKLDWDQSDRQGMVSGSLGGSGADVSSEYVITHVSNNHLVPATDNIRKAMATIEAGDIVRIDGRLVNVRLKTDDSRVLTVNTSKKRSDQGDGACEIIYVEELSINGLSY
ncbi:MAG: hypothetical protein WC935_00500 [Thermoleophilia bacterium]